uniref:Uncharacterized protein n=1 Tax=Oryza punctata TaxID=4537 RepID=A0A0E0LJZ8_ORYPU
MVAHGERAMVAVRGVTHPPSPPSATRAEIETISSLADANEVLENRGINQVEEINQVQFCLHERTSLVAATKCMSECDQELIPLEAHIAELKRLLLLPDNEIEDIGPDILQRDPGLQQVLYLHPPFPLYPEYEYHPPPQLRIPYQPAYTTDEERENARSRDCHAQRAWWHTNLTLLVTKKKILEGKRIDLERGLRSEMKKALESQSDLGVDSGAGGNVVGQGDDRSGKAGQLYCHISIKIQEFIVENEQKGID